MDTFSISHGDVKQLNLIARRKISGDPVDLTGATEIQVSFDALAGGSPIVRKLSVSGQVVLVDAKFGKFGIPIDGTLSATLKDGDGQDVEVILTLPSEGPVTINYPGIFSVKKRKGES